MIRIQSNDQRCLDLNRIRVTKQESFLSPSEQIISPHAKLKMMLKTMLEVLAMASLTMCGGLKNSFSTYFKLKMFKPYPNWMLGLVHSLFGRQLRQAFQHV